MTGFWGDLGKLLNESMPDLSKRVNDTEQAMRNSSLLNGSSTKRSPSDPSKQLLGVFNSTAWPNLFQWLNQTSRPNLDKLQIKTNFSALDKWVNHSADSGSIDKLFNISNWAELNSWLNQTASPDLGDLKGLLG